MKRQWDLSSENLKRLRDNVMSAWEFIHGATMDITGDHSVLLSHPVKTPSLEVYDNLGKLFKIMREKVAEAQPPKEDCGSAATPTNKAIMPCLCVHDPIEGQEFVLQINDQCPQHGHLVKRSGTAQ